MAKRRKTGNSMNQINGFEDMQDLFKSLADRAQDVYENEIAKAAVFVENATKRNINDGPTGNLRNSVTLRKYSGQKRVSYKITAGGISAPHAHLVEFGHQLVIGGKVVGDVPAHSFLRKAFEDNKSRIEKSLNDALDELLKEV